MVRGGEKTHNIKGFIVPAPGGRQLSIVYPQFAPGVEGLVEVLISVHHLTALRYPESTRRSCVLLAVHSESVGFGAVGAICTFLQPPFDFIAPRFSYRETLGLPLLREVTTIL